MPFPADFLFVGFRTALRSTLTMEDREEILVSGLRMKRRSKEPLKTLIWIVYTFLGDIIFETGCDHVMSMYYYYASVKNKCSWKACPCQTLSDCEDGKYTACIGECPSMGYLADKTKRNGRFYLKTTSKEPFCGTWVSFVHLHLWCKAQINLPSHDVV